MTYSILYIQYIRSRQFWLILLAGAAWMWRQQRAASSRIFAMRVLFILLDICTYICGCLYDVRVYVNLPPSKIPFSLHSYSPYLCMEIACIPYIYIYFQQLVVTISIVCAPITLRMSIHLFLSHSIWKVLSLNTFLNIENAICSWHMVIYVWVYSPFAITNIKRVFYGDGMHSYFIHIYIPLTSRWKQMEYKLPWVLFHYYVEIQISYPRFCSLWRTSLWNESPPYMFF